MFIKPTADRGFSVVEMLVAVALFSAVVLMCISAMIVLVDANQKTRATKVAMDNLEFVIDDMVRDLRLGSKYYCQSSANSTVTTDSDGAQDCVYVRNDTSSGGQYLLFRDKTNHAVSYRFANGCINKRVSSNNWSTSYTDNLTNYTCLISSDITVDRFRFYVYNTDSNSNAQPYVVITAKVTVGPSSKPRLQTTFSLQTTVSQRVPHNAE